MSSELGKLLAVMRGGCIHRPVLVPSQRVTRARLGRRAWCLLVLGVGTTCLSGCGGNGRPSLATAEQSALALLRNSPISRRVVALSYAADEAPTTCLIQPEAGASDRFQLFVTWKPSTVIGAQLPQSVLLASVSDASASKDTFEVATYRDRLGRPVSLAPSVVADLARASLNQSASQCEVLDNGQLELASAAGA